MSNNNSMAKLYDKVKFFDNVKILPGGISNPPSEPPAPLIPLYALSRSVASTDEGTSITFTLSTAHVANGTAVPYVINGISEQDLIAGSLTGSFVVNAGSSTLSFTIAEDTLTEGTETLTLSAANKTASVSILDTSRAPIYEVYPGLDYKLSRSVASANEGSVVAYTLSSWFFGQGDVVPYTIGGIAAEDLLAGSLTGSFVFGNTNTATLSFAIATDLLTEGSEVMTLSAIEKASSITINDTSTTPEYPAAYKLTRWTASTEEGGNITFTLSSVNVPAGTIIPYKITGISQDDLYAGYVEGNFVIDYDGTSTVGFNIAQDLLTEGTETMTISAANKTASISILDTSLSPQYTIVRSATATDEGTTVTYTLSSNTAPDYTLVPYTVTGINAADLSSGSLTGNFNVISQTASVSFTLANDLLMEGPETMTISAGGKTSSIRVNDTSLNPLYALSRSAASTNEGTTVTYTLSTARVDEGAQVPYKITGLSAIDLSSGLLEGAFVVDSAGFATLSLTLANDQLTEGTETMTLSAGNRTSAISIADTSKLPTYALTRSAASANEGTTVIYTLATTSVLSGTEIPYTITGISQEDLSFGSLQGNFVVNNNTASVSATLASDMLTEGTETMTIFVVDKSSSITVNDTSILPEVVLLLNGDTISDSSPFNRTITAFGNVTVSTTVKKYGSGSLAFDGTGDYLRIPASSSLVLGLADFTIEFWCNFTTMRHTSPNSRILRHGENASNRIQVYIDGLRSSKLGQIAIYTNVDVGSDTNEAVNDGNWHHIAFARQSNVLRSFVDGVLKTEVDNNTNFDGSEIPYEIGTYYNGFLDDFRVTRGAALYTANFTPPTGPLTINI